MTKILRTLAVAAVAATAFAGAAQAASVALFTNTTYVRYAPCGTEIWWCEASNLEASLKLYHHHVDKFTGITQADFHSVLEGKDVLVIPELQADLFAALTAGARTEITEFVNGGGSLIFFGVLANNRNLVNGLFGYSVTSTGAGASFTLSPGGSAGTAFQGGVASVPGTLSATNALLRTSLPAGSRTIYFSGSGDGVSLIPQGAGFVIFIGWDWFNAPPTGTAAAGGWLDVLNAAVNQAVDPTKADVALLSSTTFVDYALGANSEASNLQASIIDRGHKVMPFDTITAARFSEVLAGRDALVIPELQNGDVFGAMTAGARDAVRDFVNAGGNLVVSGQFGGRDRILINGLFGFSLSGTTCTFAGTPTFPLDAAAAAGTPFQGGPSILRDWSDTCGVNLGSLPPGARAIYRSAGNVAVAVMPVGCGSVTFLGWDWWNAAPEGAWDGGWNDVLNRALGQTKRQFVANDFNGDGHADILFRNSGNGNLSLWLMEDNVKQSAAAIGSLSPAIWEMAGTGDFNRDCKADVLWHNPLNGNTVVWLMDGFTKTSGVIGVPPLSFQVRSIKDYNRDGASDILWRNVSNGSLVMWYMDGFIKTAQVVATLPLVWGVEE